MEKAALWDSGKAGYFSLTIISLVLNYVFLFIYYTCVSVWIRGWMTGVGNDVTNPICYSDLDTYIAKSLDFFNISVVSNNYQNRPSQSLHIRGSLSLFSGPPRVVSEYLPSNVTKAPPSRTQLQP